MQTVNKSLYSMLKFTNRPKTPGIIFKNMAWTGGDQQFPGVFHVFMDEIEADMLQIAKKLN